MLKRIILIVRHLVVIGRWRSWLFYAVILAVVLTPAVSVRLANYLELRRELTALTVARRQSVAVSVAQALREQLERAKDFSVSLAIHPQIRLDVATGKWDEAIAIADTNLTLTHQPSIDRIFLADAHGILQADSPALPGVRGQDFSQREWFTGVVGTDQPIVTSVYQRTALPQLHVISVAAPVTDEDNRIIGIIAAQISLDHFFDWVKSISIGDYGFIYIVDQKGQLVAHPNFPPQGKTIDFSDVPPVQRVLQGQTGVMLAYNPIEREERLTAYAPVKPYGWGVLAQEPTANALGGQTKTLRQFVLLETIGGIWNLLILMTLLTIIHRLLQYLIVARHFVPPLKTANRPAPSPAKPKKPVR
jgi:methyl-accepting chemotaxis protein